MNPQPKLLALICLLLAVIGCSKPVPQPPTPADLSEARMQDFKLNEVAYSRIDIHHPEVQNGVETKRGEIKVYIPQGSTGLRLTPLTTNFTSSRFSIAPQLGTLRDFSAGAVTFTIVANDNPNRKVHYDVQVIEETPPVSVTPKITGLKFEKSRNAGLPSDIAATSVVEGVATLGKIFIFVPAGTDFSQLTPTITYEGGALYYSQDPNSSLETGSTPYPASGLKINFAWPKVFYVVVKSATATAATYEVIVDVRNPIKFDAAATTTANLRKGALHNVPVGSFVNQGNRPITLQSVTHTGQVPTGINAIRCMATIPSQGLLPGQRTTVTATISAQTFPAGTYQSTAIFNPGFYRQIEANALLEPSTFKVTTTIVD